MVCNRIYLQINKNYLARKSLYCCYTFIVKRVSRKTYFSKSHL